MDRIVFETERPAVNVDPDRTDVACFAGLVRLTGAPLPEGILDWLDEHDWVSGPYARQLDPPFDLPIPIETYAAFTSLFDPGGSASSSGTDYLAAAVRSFFAQGGRRCYIVRMGDPVTSADNEAAKQKALTALLPDSSFLPGDPRSWHGIGHLAGLPDVSILAVPDLPVLHASQPTGAKGKEPVVPAGPETFVECSASDVTPRQSRVFDSPAPRLAPADYVKWGQSVRTVLQYLKSGAEKHVPHLREIQFVAALPLPQDLDSAAAAEEPSSEALAQDVRDVIAAQLPETGDLNNSLSTAFLQLSYPWLKTTGSHVLLESLEPPDGALAGLVARNALTRGGYASATKVIPSGIYDLWPLLPAAEQSIPARRIPWDGRQRRPLVERLSLFGFTPVGLRLLSDVTCFAGESYRPARVNRLVCILSRAVRRLGEEITFDLNGEALWTRVRLILSELMTRLWRLGALEGASAKDAFAVRCDRGTMTQNDIDSGRLIAEVVFTAAATIELIRVSLSLEASPAANAALTGVA